MLQLRTLIVAALIGLASWFGTPRAEAQSYLNKPLPKVELDGLHQTNATSLDDYAGRALLIEFFAHW